jgi:hypothetical protein
MKSSPFVFLFCLVMCFSACVSPTSSTPSAATQAAEYKTLATVGAAGKAAVDTAAQLLRANKITVAQFSKVAAIYDNKFQPAFNLALTVAQTNLTQPAPADLLAILNQLTALVASFQ